MSLDATQWSKYVRQLAGRLDMQDSTGGRVNIVNGDARALRDCADFLAALDAPPAIELKPRDNPDAIIRSLQSSLDQAWRQRDEAYARRDKLREEHELAVRGWQNALDELEALRKATSPAPEAPAS